MTKFKLAIIGEAYGEEEALWKKPFVGAAGKQLDSLLEDTGIKRDECFITNTFNFQPTGNRLETICGEKRDPLALGSWPPLIPGKYLRKEFQGEIDRLVLEMEEVRPNLAILCGNTPCWALLERQAVSKIRGTCTFSSRLPWLKCLPTYHPAAILRQYDLRHVTMLDFLKAKREREFPELIRPRREIWLEPTLEDMREYKRRYLDAATDMAFDIETNRRGQITCISFAASIDRALVVPFFDDRKPKRNYWPTLGDELAAWDLVAEILSLPARKVGQNGLFDIQHLWMIYGIVVVNYDNDDMLLHHSLQPESDKGLGFLGSVYTNEPAWKVERGRGKETIKKED